MRSESFRSASNEGAGVHLFGEYTSPSGAFLVAEGVVVGGAGVYLFGECTGPSRVFLAAGSVAVVAVAVAGKLVSAGVRAEAAAQASGTNTFASGERRNALAGRKRAGTRLVPVPVPTGRRPRRLRWRKRKVLAARVSSVGLLWLQGRKEEEVVSVEADILVARCIRVLVDS